MHINSNEPTNERCQFRMRAGVPLKLRLHGTKVGLNCEDASSLGHFNQSNGCGARVHTDFKQLMSETGAELQGSVMASQIEAARASDLRIEMRKQVK